MKKYIKYLERKAVKNTIRFAILLLLGYCALQLSSCNKNPNPDTDEDYCEVQIDGGLDCE